MIKKTLVEYFNESIVENWDLLALADYKGVGFTYGQLGERIKKTHLFFEKSGIKKGDKVALIGKNSAEWAVSFLAIVSYGAVVVPILPDFTPNDVHHIVTHSDAKLFFVSSHLYPKYNFEEMKALEGILILNDNFLSDYRIDKIKTAYDSFETDYNNLFPNGLKPEDLKFENISNDELAAINYTSGTTGFSKGVMLNHKSLASNIKFAEDNMPLKSGDAIVSFLPLAHAYGMAFEFLFPFSIGCQITFLTRTPSPAIITKAFKEIKPRLILSVPLVIEKIFKKKIKPQIEKPIVSTLLKIPLLNKLIYKKVLAGLNDGFGGNFEEVVIGGAAFNEDIEKLFKKIGFPFTIGYGMTECGPLISYASWKEMRIGSCGKPVDAMQVKIDSEDPINEVGEILVKGDHLMLGYYKNPEATAEAIDKDGWLHTGDLGLMDKDNFIYIKGRSKNMILGASGQNIFPEEIESTLNKRAYIGDSLVVERKGKLVALVYPDYEYMKLTSIDELELEAILEKYRVQANKNLPAYMRITKMICHSEAFEKTPKQSIKRFLYNKVEV
ncbi:AMP-binding protein [Lutibacter sp. A64]|uniref:AMP-binding protein n=1 Tax=Lutibacter sp. A64 TaxID=2918526 RepID=UPI001F05B192|nr:AMP-binding protein [Lutibacter sp. A64]UMB55099.1 AMP-binding protein [Lutibacter sp. A64]